MFLYILSEVNLLLKMKLSQNNILICDLIECYFECISSCDITNGVCISKCVDLPREEAQ